MRLACILPPFENVTAAGKGGASTVTHTSLMVATGVHQECCGVKQLGRKVCFRAAAGLQPVCLNPRDRAGAMLPISEDGERDCGGASEVPACSIGENRMR